MSHIETILIQSKYCKIVKVNIINAEDFICLPISRCVDIKMLIGMLVLYTMSNRTLWVLLFHVTLFFSVAFCTFLISFFVLFSDGFAEPERDWEEIEIPVPWGHVAGNNSFITLD